jgi:hypothetical protein
VSSDLTRVPPRQRQFLSLLIAPTGLALFVAGALLSWRSGALTGHLIGAGIAIIAIVLLGVAHGLFSSARRDRYEASSNGSAATASVDATCGADCGSCAGDCAIRSLPRS